jgi:hypothetical protein
MNTPRRRNDDGDSTSACGCRPRRSVTNYHGHASRSGSLAQAGTVPAVPAGHVLGHRGERRVHPAVPGAPRVLRPHPRRRLGARVAQDARVIVEQLGEDVAPEPAQPLPAAEHGHGAARRLVSRLKRSHITPQW